MSIVLCRIIKAIQTFTIPQNTPLRLLRKGNKHPKWNLNHKNSRSSHPQNYPLIVLNYPEIINVKFPVKFKKRKKNRHKSHEGGEKKGKPLSKENKKKDVNKIEKKLRTKGS